MLRKLNGSSVVGAVWYSKKHVKEQNQWKQCGTVRSMERSRTNRSSVVEAAW